MPPAANLGGICSGGLHMDFTERTELEKGFAEIFRARVRPALMAIESDRVVRLWTARKWVAIILAATAAAVALLLFAVEGEFAAFAAFFLGIVGVIGALGVRAFHAHAWSGAVEDAVMPAICEHVGDLTFASDGGGGFPVGAFRELGMVGSYNKSNIRNEMTGSHRGTDYRIVQATLEKETRNSDNKKSSSTVFNGLMFHISVPMQSPGRILITRDYGALGNTLGGLFAGDRGRGMPRVEFDHDTFEDAFEVHAEDPEAARRFMPPRFLDSVLAIGAAEGGRRGTKAMKAGFWNDDFYLALSRGGGFMKMGALNKPVTDMEDDLHEIFDDIDLARRIIDRLHGD